MEIRELRKSEYTEWVVRNALYWISPLSRWTLSHNSSHWTIKFETPSEDVSFEFNRLLNDYTLREKVMAKTSRTREAIVSSVLEGIQKRLAE